MANLFIKQPQNASWIELDRSKFKNNVSVYRQMIGKNVLLGCVLKGNAYGHGFCEMLTMAYENPLDIIFVINPNDAFHIRKFEKSFNHPKKRVVVLGPLMPEEALECAKQDIEVSLGDEHFKEHNYFQALKKYKSSHNKTYKPLKVHIHLDTGLAREGIRIEDLNKTLTWFKTHRDCIFIQGIMSHFSNVEDVTEQSYAKEQLAVLDSAYDKIIKILKLNHKPEKHIAQSAATLIFPKNHYDIARVGISLYGHWPSVETKISAKVLLSNLPHLTPILSWKTKSQTVKELLPNSFIGYGCSYRTDRKTRIAVLPVGYHDGYPRSLSNIGFTLVNQKRCKILGRVMMNYCIIDVTEATQNTAPIEATLIGSSGSEKITAEMLANWANTIQYEILTRIGPHLHRTII